MTTTTLYAPDNYPSKKKEIRAYTVAAFQVAQRTDQLSLVPMRRDMVRFLIKDRAFGYWKTNGWLQDEGMHAVLLPSGLEVCRQAMANQQAGFSADPCEISYWTRQFTMNSALPRIGTFSV